jgi:MFS family permease
MPVNDQTPLSPGYKLYAARFTVLAVFSLFSATSAIHWIAFAPIANTVMSLYGTSAIAVNSLSGTWMLTYVIFSPPASAIVEGKGLRYAVLAGALLTFFGSIIRFVGTFFPPTPVNFWLSLWTGNAIVSLGQLFVLAVPPVLSARWFGARERVMATTAASLANSAGIAIGFFAAPAVVTSVSMSEFSIWMGIQLALAFLATVLCFAAVRARPATPPSASQDPGIAVPLPPNQQEHQPVVKNVSVGDVAQALRRSAFLLLLFAFSIVVGLLYAVSTILTQLLQDNYAEADAGTLGGIMVVAGAVGSLPIGPVLDRWRNFKSMLILVTLVFLASIVFLDSANVPNNFGALAAACALFGVSSASMIALGLELATEVTYPISEAVGGAALMIGGNLLGLISLIVFSLLPADSSSSARLAMYVFMGMAASALLASVVMPRDYRRLELERQAKQKRDSQRSLFPVAVR